MNKLFFWLALILVTGGLLGVICLGGRPAPTGASIEKHRSLLISHITEMAELVTLKVPVSTVLTSKLAGYIGSIKCVIVVYGEVELGVDMEAIRFEDVDPVARSATLILPEPKVRHARLDHERTMIYSLSREGLWWVLMSDEPARRLVNDVMKRAETVVKSTANEPHLEMQARRKAEVVLQSAFQMIEWKIDLVWDE